MAKNVEAKSFTMYDRPGGGFSSLESGNFAAGVWTEISPPCKADFGDIVPEFGFDWVTNSESEPGVYYACVDQRGLWRSEDYGTTWALVTPEPEDPYDFSGHTTYLDSPVRVFVNPDDGDHLIATQGVRGATLGFWVSTDRGQTWDWPAGFTAVQASATNDVTNMVVDPTDFDHIIIGSHSPWAGPTTAGVLETTDGGATPFTLRAADAAWPGGSFALGMISSSVWIVGTDGEGIWRTTNNGVSWTKVSDFEVLHGGGELTKMANGDWYLGGDPYPLKSTDDGVTWTQVTGVPSAFYYSVCSDGDYKFTQMSNTGVHDRGPQTWWKAAEGSDTWVEDGTDEFANGPYNMFYDSTCQAIIAAQWLAGIYARGKG